MEIEIITDHYTEEDLQKYTVGAGIVPFMISPQKEIFLILGKEKITPRWKGSDKWSGFEGGRKNPETVEETAAREFCEESLNCICVNTSSKQCLYSDILNMLQNKEYTLRLVFCTKQAKKCMQYHVTYVIQVPFQINTTKKFMEKRIQLLQLEEINRNLNNMSCDFLDGKPYMIEGMAYEKSIIKSIFKAYVQSDKLAILLQTETDQIYTYESYIKDIKSAMKYTEWLNERNRLKKLINAIGEDSAYTVVWLNNTVNAVDINDDYLEKQYIKNWSLSELKTVVHNCGFLNSEFYRVYFMPVLQQIIVQLEILMHTTFIDYKSASLLHPKLMSSK